MALELAAQRPTSRPARLLAQASMLASRSDRPRDAARLLKKARWLDATDPAVTLAEADGLRDPDARLVLLESLQAEDPLDKAHAACLRAEAHAHTRDLPAALAAIADAKTHAPDSLRPVEIEATARLLYAVDRIEQFGPDPANLLAAQQGFLDLATELEAFGRAADGALLRARAAQCHLLLADRSAAEALLSGVNADLVPRWEVQAACEIATVMTEVGRANDAIALLKRTRGGGGAVELARAEARIESKNASRRKAGVAALERLLDSDVPGIRLRAAFDRQSLLAESEASVGPSAAAHAVLAESDPALAALLSVAGAGAKDRRSAEVVLLPHSEDPRVLHRLADLAAADGDDTRAIDLIGAAAQKTSTPRVHLRHAYLLARAGRGGEALPSLRTMQDNGSLTVGLRVQAVILELETRAERLEWDQVERLARRWRELEPTAVNADWEIVHALARLGRHPDALAHIDANSLEPDSINRAELAAAVIYRAEEPLERLERLAALSDRFERASERLELHLLMAGTAVGDQPLRSELEERLRSAWAAFTTRFPDSTALRVIPVGPDLSGLKEFLAEQFADSVESDRDLWRQVRDGEVPVAVVAGARYSEVTTFWGRLTGGLPLGFASAALDDLEREDAAAAIGGPIVLDASALVVVGGLGPSVAAAVLSAFPGSVIPQSVLDDADRASADAVMSAGQSERGFLGWDPDRPEPRLTELSQEDAERDAARARGVLALARRLRVVPDRDLDHPHPLDDVLADTSGRGAEAFVTWPATHAVADRLGRAVYSDDRVVRNYVRGEGRPAFGTPAILDALAEAGLLPRPLRTAARRRLWASGASGLVPSREEILEAGRRQRWDLSEDLVTMLVDPAPWRTDSAQAHRRWLDVLRAIEQEAPDRLEAWATRVITAAHEATDRKTIALASAHALIAMAWQPWDDASMPFLRALVRALRAAGRVLGFDDPLPGAFYQLDRFWRTAVPQIAPDLRWLALTQLEATDMLHLGAGVTPSNLWMRRA